MSRFVIAVACFLIGCAGVSAQTLDNVVAERLAGRARKCVHRAYPNRIAHVLNSEKDARTPSELTPAFYGCYDWHSAVHGHWLLARLARTHPQSPAAKQAREALAKSLTAENIAEEVRYLKGEGRASFERPYGLAWLLQLGTELREWNDPQAREWSRNLEPLELAAVERLRTWLPKLSYPVRSGEHSQSAFGLGLILDWARARGDREFESLLTAKIEDFYLDDRDCPIEYEPSGEDFVSPCLAEADVVRRVLAAPKFAAWLGSFLPSIPLDGSRKWIQPAVV